MLPVNHPSYTTSPAEFAHQTAIIDELARLRRQANEQDARIKELERQKQEDQNVSTR